MVYVIINIIITTIPHLPTRWRLSRTMSIFLPLFYNVKKATTPSTLFDLSSHRRWSVSQFAARIRRVEVKIFTFFSWVNDLVPFSSILIYLYFCCCRLQLIGSVARCYLRWIKVPNFWKKKKKNYKKCQILLRRS